MLRYQKRKKNALEKLKKLTLKSSFPYCPELPKEFMFQDVACRPTVYKTGECSGFPVFLQQLLLQWVSAL
jgi:hypothetical protein